MVTPKREPGQEGRWVEPHAPRNHLLEALTANDWTSIEPLLERVELAVSQALEMAGEVSPWLHFPESAIISVVNTLGNGRQVEVGSVGNEGMCGLSAWHEAQSDESLSVCTLAGAALRGRASEIIAMAEQRPAMRRLVNRYAGAYVTLVAQGTACNRAHAIEQRCARLLLMMRDRLPDQHLVVTPVLLAAHLGVSAKAAMLALESLRGDGVIRATRNFIDIVDRDALERIACSCYNVIRDRFANLA